VAEVSSERIRSALVQCEGTVRRNQKMVRLNDRLTDVLRMNELLVRTPDFGELGRLYREWGFRSLAAEAEELASGGQRDLFTVAP
jgi:hypothetical protein